MHLTLRGNGALSDLCMPKKVRVPMALKGACLAHDLAISACTCGAKHKKARDEHANDPR